MAALTPLRKAAFDAVEVPDKGDSTARWAVFTISTSDIDREGDVILPEGGDFTDYLKNPVVLAVHNSYNWPVGKTESIQIVDGKRIVAKVTFPDGDDDIDRLYNLIKQGFVKGASVGINVLEQGPPTKDEIKANPDWAAARNIIRRWSIVEWSICPIGMNQNALLEAVSKGYVLPVKFTKAIEADAAKPTDPQLVKRLEAKRMAAFDQKGAVPYEKQSYMEGPFDHKAALERVRKHASFDGSGHADKMDWDKYEKAFAHVNAARVDKFDGYSLLHHDVDKSGTMCLHKAGLQNASHKIVKGEHNIPDEHMEETKDHLRKHYEEMKSASPFDRHEPEKPAEGDKEQPKPTDNDGDEKSVSVVESTADEKSVDAEQSALIAKALETIAQRDNEENAVLALLPAMVEAALAKHAGR